jgi:hypothetical protein
MKNRKRAERRHHNKRLLRNRYKREVGNLYVSHDRDMDKELEGCLMRARVRVGTNVPCSCAMCGNPRRKHGFASVTGKCVTFQELRANDAQSDGIEEIFLDSNIDI